MVTQSYSPKLRRKVSLCTFSNENTKSLTKNTGELDLCRKVAIEKAEDGPVAQLHPPLTLVSVSHA